MKKIAEARIAGGSLRSIAALVCNVHPSTLSRWFKQVEEHIEQGLESRVVCRVRSVATQMSVNAIVKINQV